MTTDLIREELERLKHAYDDMRREIRELRGADAGLSRRRGVLASAGTTAESLLKFIYRREGREKGAKPADKLMLDDLVGALKEVLPEHIQVPLRTVQAYRNLGAHDKGDIRSVDEQALLTVNTALNQVVVWFFEAYLGGEFAALAKTREHDEPSGATAEKPALVEWRELYWWLMRGGQLKLLDQKALEKRQRESGLTDGEVGSIRSNYKRDVETFLQAVAEAVEDGLLEDYEVEGLEEMRVSACISAREAQELAAERMRKVDAVPAVAPGWMTYVLAEAQRAEEARRPKDKLTARGLATDPAEVSELAEQAVAFLAPEAFRTTPAAVAPELPSAPAGVPVLSAARARFAEWPAERAPPQDAWWTNRKVVRKALDEVAKRLQPHASALGATCELTGGAGHDCEGLLVSVGPGVGIKAVVNIDGSWAGHFAWLGTTFEPNDHDVSVESPAATALRARLSDSLLAELAADGPAWIAVPSSPLPETSLIDFLDAVTKRVPVWAMALLPVMKGISASLPAWAVAAGKNGDRASDELIALEDADARNNFAYCYRAGLLCWYDDKVEEAMRYFERAAVLDATSPAPLLYIAHCYNYHDAHASALASFRRALELSAWAWIDADELHMAARSAAKCGDRAFAVLVRQELARREPDSADAWCWLGVALNRDRRPDEAEAALRKSIESEPKMHAVHSLARLLSRRRDYAGARAVLALLSKTDGSLPKSSVSLQKELEERERRKSAGEADHDDDDDDGDEDGEAA